MNYVLHETSKKRKGLRLIESAGCPHVSNGEGHVTDDIVTHIRKRKRTDKMTTDKIKFIHQLNIPYINNKKY